MNLSEEATKKTVIELSGKGNSYAKIGEALGIPKSTVGDFLSRNTYTDWWDSYDENLPSQESPITEVVLEPLVCSDIVTVETSSTSPDFTDHLVIPDTQCKEGVDMSYLSWIGEYIVDRQPSTIVHLGDHADMPSLCSYDRGRKTFEGRRVTRDINAAIEGMNLLLAPLKKYQAAELKLYGEIRYKPRLILTLGNHEERILRHVEANPELIGFLSLSNLKYKEMGWEVYDFLKPVVVNGVTYVHYLANPMSGKPYGGMASNILKHVGESFTVGHKQTLDITTRFLPASGRQQWGIIAGACYLHEEDYKGPQGNHHWRGIIVKHKVSEGSYNPMFVDLGFLKRKYGGR